MKMPERSCTSRIPQMDIPFAQKSFCYDGLRHTHTNLLQTGPIILHVPPLLKWEDEGHYSIHLGHLKIRYVRSGVIMRHHMTS